MLVNLLEKAVSITAGYTGGYSGQHLSAEDFHRDLLNRLEKLKNGNVDVLNDLWGWFAPTCQWDDFVGDADLGQEVFDQIQVVQSISK